MVFLPGGTGSRTSAQRTWDKYVSGGARVNAYRVVIPYADADDFIDEANRTFDILEEVLTCYGGDTARVHLAGFSNGGLAAYALMLRQAQCFATLLGAPGLFPTQDHAAWARALAGHAVFNGVGENDSGWKAKVKATHEALLAEGIESFYVEFAGEGHGVSAAFDENVFFDFWDAH